MKTKQEIFDKVANHLLTQMKRSQLDTEDENCAYRSPDGLVCAIGCLIPDEEYRPGIEKKTIWTLFNNSDYCPPSLLKIKDHVHFLKSLQDIHDEYPTQFWKEELRKLAEKYELKVFEG